jgi:hypothetical protein
MPRVDLHLELLSMLMSCLCSWAQSWHGMYLWFSTHSWILKTLAWFGPPKFHLFIMAWCENKTYVSQGWKFFLCSQSTLLSIKMLGFHSDFPSILNYGCFLFIVGWHLLTSFMAFRPFDRSWSWFIWVNWHSWGVHCCNPSLRLTTKASACKGEGQRGKLGSHISCSQECRIMWGNEPSHSQVNSHFENWSPNGL